MEIAYLIIDRRKGLVYYGPLKYDPCKVVRASILTEPSNINFSGFIVLFFIIIGVNNLRLII
jgi:hypothetical protein